MANLLPKEQIHSLKRERTMRLIALALAFLVALELLAIVFLAPSFLLSRSKRESTALQVATVDQLIARREQNEATLTIQNTQHRLEELVHVAEYPSVTGYVEEIVSERGEGIVLDGLTYRAGSLLAEEESDTDVRITISGRSTTRDGLLTFVRNLEHTATFSSVELPVSNLAQRTDIPFTLHITVADQSTE